MTTINVYKAQPSIKPVKDLHINMAVEIPDADTLAIGNLRFAADAAVLEEVLYNTLPGGTYDRLLGEMLRRKASHFIVAHGGDE